MSDWIRRIGKKPRDPHCTAFYPDSNVYFRSKYSAVKWSVEDRWLANVLLKRRVHQLCEFYARLPLDFIVRILCSSDSWLGGKKTHSEPYYGRWGKLYKSVNLPFKWYKMFLLLQTSGIGQTEPHESDLIFVRKFRRTKMGYFPWCTMNVQYII